MGAGTRLARFGTRLVASTGLFPPSVRPFLTPQCPLNRRRIVGVMLRRISEPPLGHSSAVFLAAAVR